MVCAEILFDVEVGMNDDCDLSAVDVFRLVCDAYTDGNSSMVYCMSRDQCMGVDTLGDIDVLQSWLEDCTGFDLC